MEPVELSESYPVTEVFMEGAANQLDQEVWWWPGLAYRKWGNRPAERSDNILQHSNQSLDSWRRSWSRIYLYDWQIMTEWGVPSSTSSQKSVHLLYLQGLFDETSRWFYPRNVIEEIIALPDAKPSLDLPTTLNYWLQMLSVQTTDAAVNKATPGLFAAFPMPRHVCRNWKKLFHITFSSGIEIRPNSKMCPTTIRRFWRPSTSDSAARIRSLAGVGQTANVVMSVGFGIPALVDTHVERICSIKDINKKSATPLEVENVSHGHSATEKWLAAHQAMIYFGRLSVIQKTRMRSLSSIIDLNCYMKNNECFTWFERVFVDIVMTINIFKPVPWGRQGAGLSRKGEVCRLQ